MDRGGKRAVARRFAHRVMALGTLAAVPALMSGPLAPGQGKVWGASVTTGRPAAADIRAAPAVLWVDKRRGWVHQDATDFAIYLRLRSPRLRSAVARAARAWSVRTKLTMRLIADPRAANVIVREGRYGSEAVTAYTQVCEACQQSLVVFNLDRLSYPRTPAVDRWLGAIACQELGHVAGLGHGGGDCMSFGYHRTRTHGIGAANVRVVDFAYRHVRSGLPARLRASHDD